MIRSMILILVALLGGIAIVPSPARAANSLVVTSYSEILIGQDGTVTVTRTIQAEPAAASILRGSSELAPQTLQAFLNQATHASNAKCQAHDDSNMLQVQCQYSYTLAPTVEGTRTAVTLPNDSLGMSLALLAVQYPQSVEWVEADSIQTPGLLLSAPPPLQRHLAQSSLLVRRVEMETMSKVNVETHVRVSPGDGLDAAVQHGEPRTLTYTQQYFPAPGTWMLWALAATSALACVVVLLPVRCIRTIEPSRLLMPLAMIIGGFFSVLGALLILFGLTWLWAAPALTAFFAQVHSFLGFLPSDGFQQWLVVLPYVTLAGGILLSVLGGGVLRRQGWARSGLAILALAGFFIVIASIPYLILLPEWIPGQGLITFLMFESGLLLTALVVWVMTRPEVRLRYDGWLA